MEQQWRIERLRSLKDVIVLNKSRWQEITLAIDTLSDLLEMQGKQIGDKIGDLKISRFDKYLGVLFLLPSHKVDYFDFQVGLLSADGGMTFSVCKAESCDTSPARSDRFHGVHDLILSLMAGRILSQLIKSVRESATPVSPELLTYIENVETLWKTIFAPEQSVETR